MSRAPGISKGFKAAPPRAPRGRLAWERVPWVTKRDRLPAPVILGAAVMREVGIFSSALKATLSPPHTPPSGMGIGQDAGKNK